MHSVSPYLLRCYDKNLTGSNNEKYAPLDRIRTLDLFNLLQAFIEPKQTNYIIVEDSKQVYRFQNMTFDNDKRIISGHFQAGTYGTKNDIINIDTGNIDFEKTQKNAEIINYYIHFFIPKGFNESIAILQSYRSQGVKTLFSDIFMPFFTGRTNLTLQMNPLAYDKAFEQWQNANAKELKITRFKGAADLSDQISNLGHIESEYIMRPTRNNTLGKLGEYFKSNSTQAAAVELLTPLGQDVKVVVEMNDKRRTFKLGGGKSNTLCEIELDDDIIGDDGNPKFTLIHTWCIGIIKEYADSMYPGLDITL